MLLVQTGGTCPGVGRRAQLELRILVKILFSGSLCWCPGAVGSALSDSVFGEGVF